MSTIETIPASAEEFQAQVEALLSDLKDRDPNDLTDEFIAKHLFDRSDDKVEMGAEEPEILRLYQAIFSTVKQLDIKKTNVHAFNGSTVDQWSGTSTGTLVRAGNPREVKFFALDGAKIPRVPIIKFLIIFFYNFQNKKFAVFAGRAIQGSLKFTRGEGKFID